MSDAPKGNDWWQGSDGLWYPPVSPMRKDVPQGQTGRRVIKTRLIVALVAVIVLSAGGFVLMSRGVIGDCDNSLDYDEPSNCAYPYWWLTLEDTKKDKLGWSVEPDCSDKGTMGTDPCECSLSLGYRDLNPSTPVVLFGKSGKEIARTSLGRGRVFSMDDPDPRHIKQSTELPSSHRRMCEWLFGFKEVKRGEEYYILKIGERSEFKYSFEQLQNTEAGFLVISDD